VSSFVDENAGKYVLFKTMIALLNSLFELRKVLTNFKNRKK
jgi:hypothetical protein